MRPGDQLAHYEIIAPLGVGGMGEVYRARDTKLGREVAVKILPVEMSGNPERIARFDREARTLASLQHPHIASIYGFEHEGDTRFLVMELAEGEDLSERIKRGRVPLDEAIEIAQQLAEGLEAAHAQGIVHRDLKPANIKLGSDGQVKILDFGLARAFSGDPLGDSDPGMSPTLTAAMTQPGVILGTAAYMSPEQARGATADQRADLWAFGVILFEMLTGRQLFAGATVSDTLAAVLRKEPEWDELPTGTPPNVRRLLRRCLSRKRRDRLRDAGDALLELREEETASGATVPAPVPRRALWPAAIVIAAALVLVAAWVFRGDAPVEAQPRPTHLTLTLPEGVQVASRDKLLLGAPQPCVAVSDDGRLIVVIVEKDDQTWLYRRFLDETTGEIVAGTEGAYCPRISPDGQWISYLSGYTLMRLAAHGDRATRVIELTNSFGHDWLNDHEIVVNRSEAHEFLRVDAERGTVTELPGENARDDFFWPRRVPGTDLVLVNSASHVAKSEETDVDQISLYDLTAHRLTPLATGGTQPRLLPDGTLLTVRDGGLVAGPFKLEDPGTSVRLTTVLDDMLIEGWIGQFDVSLDGTLVYVPGSWLFGTELVWDDGQGNIEPLGFPVLGHGDFELSPDGTMLAVTLGGGGDSQAWIYDLERGGRRLLSTEGFGASPIWSPDGQRLAYSAADGDSFALVIRELGASAATTLIRGSNNWMTAYAWDATAGLLINYDQDIMLIDPDGQFESRLVAHGAASEWGPDFSPDGRWFAYTSDESGRYEIYVRALDGDRSWTVSLEGGEEPIFSADGKTLHYRYGNRFFATPILEMSADGRRFRAGKPQVVVEGAYSNVPGLSYDVGLDGRLLVLRSDGGTERPGYLNVVLNWDVALRGKLAGGE